MLHAIKVNNPNSITFLEGHLYTSGMWFGVAPIKKKTSLNIIRLQAQKSTTILSSIINIIGKIYIII